MTSAMAGMAAAMQRLDTTASKAASGDTDIAAQAVDLAQAKIQMRANVAVVRATNEMMGTLLDILA